MRETVIPISRIVGGGICVSATDGHKVYEQVRREVLARNTVVLSFSGVSRMTTAFLNAAVGQLYGEFGEDVVRKQLAPPRDYEPWHLARLKLVVDRAKDYFTNKERVEKAFEDNTGDNQ